MRQLKITKQVTNRNCIIRQIFTRNWKKLILLQLVEVELAKLKWGSKPREIKYIYVSQFQKINSQIKINTTSTPKT
jgi:hypothetical protein